MSQSVTNVDIEDVLDSIRRLVLDRSGDRPGAVPAAAVAAAPSGRLLLTPSLRIMDGPEGVATIGTPTAAASASGAEASDPDRSPGRPDPLVLVGGRGGWEVDVGETDDGEAPSPTGAGARLASEAAPPEEAAPVFRSRSRASVAGGPRLAPRRAAKSGPQAGGASTINEDLLRALVAEAVRRELEGDLGERITHNVRKLVRREIFAILASRDAG